MTYYDVGMLFADLALAIISAFFGYIHGENHDQTRPQKR